MVVEVPSTTKVPPWPLMVLVGMVKDPDAVLYPPPEVETKTCPFDRRTLKDHLIQSFELTLEPVANCIATPITPLVFCPRNRFPVHKLQFN